MIDNSTLHFNNLLPIDDDGVEFWDTVEEILEVDGRSRDVWVSTLEDAIFVAQQKLGLYHSVHDILKCQCYEWEVPKINLFLPGPGTHCNFEEILSDANQHWDDIVRLENSEKGTW